MTDITQIVSILNLLGLGGLGLFLYYVIKGLTERVANLTDLANEQKATLEAVRARAIEMDRLSKDYKQALTDFQDMGKKLDERRNELVKELELANLRKDQELARLANLELEEIELKKRSLQRLPEIERRLDETVSELGRQLKIVSPSLLVQFKSRPRHDLWRNWLSHEWSDIRLEDSTSQRFLYLLLSSTLHEGGRPRSSKKPSGPTEPSSQNHDTKGEDSPGEKPPDEPEDAS